METNTKIGIGVILTMILGFTYVGISNLEPNYYCLNKEIKSYCFDLSESGITCYTLQDFTGGKRCPEGWQKIPFEIKQEFSERIHCDNQGCI